MRGWVRANTTKEKGSFESEEEKDAIFAFALQAQGAKKKINASNKVYLWDGKEFSVDRIVHFVADELTIKPPKDLSKMFQKRDA